MKVCLIGDSGVGKTSLATRVCRNTFDENDVTTTIGASFLSATHDGTLLELWDVAGDHRYRSLTPLYLRNAHVVWILNDCVAPVHPTWLKFVETHGGDACVLYVRTKCDDADENADETNLLRTSARTGYGVDRLLKRTVREGREVEKMRERELSNPYDPLIELPPRKYSTIFC